MRSKLHYETVKPILRSVLTELMTISEFEPFCLVGGTSLSLRFGHRISDDIDLFTDAEYNSIDFHKLQEILRQRFPYCKGDCGDPVSFGASYIVGNSDNDAVKLDLFYTDSHIRPTEKIENLRIASVDDIVAMKVDVVSRGGRKKDFWDLHELHSKYSIKEMIALHAERYPYSHEEIEIIDKFSDFTVADSDPDPNCLKGNVWQFIKLDFMDWLN